MTQETPRQVGRQGLESQGHFFLARSAASRAAMLRAAVIRWMTLMRDFSKATGAVIHSPIRKRPTEPTVGREQGNAENTGRGRGRGPTPPWAGQNPPPSSPAPHLLPKGPSEKLNR